MADISQYLQAIMSAVYGEDVRSSIHDAIAIINDVSEVVLSTGTAITGPTSSSAGFYQDSLYLNTSTFELWKCTGQDSWASQGVVKGSAGNGIASITKTGTSGLVDTYTITYTDTTTTTFTITNGEDGEDGNRWFRGTAISGKATNPTVYPTGITYANPNDFYLNPTEGAVYHCVSGGDASTATWSYDFTMTGGGGGGSIVGWTQIQGSTGAIKIAEISIDGNVTDVYAPQGGGILPYLYIDSEAGATVTVDQPDGTTITPTAAGSGHWECELTGGFGTYVIHSVLSGQGDATVSLNVDTVKEYHITDNHFDFTINVTAPSGSTIRITATGETYTATGTGLSQVFAVHQASTQYTIQVTMDGNTKSDTVTSAATTGQSTSVNFENQFGTVIVNVDNAFVTAGSTISCVNGGTSCTPKTAASTVTFRVPSTGTWTVSGEVGGTTYAEDAAVTSLSTPVTISLQTTTTVNVTLYSAVEDTVTFTDASGAKTEVFATGQSSKQVTLSIAIAGENITFTSGIAKDPSDLTQYYSKTVFVDENTTDIYIMPDNVLYWYGYENTTLTGGSNFAGWSNSIGGTTIASGTYNTNNYSCGNGVSGQMNGYGTVNKIDITNFSDIKLLTNYVSDQYYGCYFQASSNKSTVTGLDANPLSPQPAKRVTIPGTQDIITALDISSYSGNYGIAVYAYNTSVNRFSALWLE